MSTIHAYSDLIVETFRKRAIRTAMLIDDKFPTYVDLIEKTGSASGAYQNDRARSVFKTFKDHHIPCDVENDPNNLTESRFERVRKSDFIVLDYHLRQENDSFDAIKLLNLLSKSKHFNLVVLYTQAPNLEEVWLEIAACLRGGWATPDIIFPDDAVAQSVWDDMAGEDQLPEPSDETLRAYLLDMDYSQEKNGWVKLFRDRNVTGKSLGKCVDAIINRCVIKRFKDMRMQPLLLNQKHNLAGKCVKGSPLWILCGGVFIAITKKKDAAEASESNLDPEGIFACLDAALIDWGPNVLRLIVSELQNILEQESLPYDATLAEDQMTQAGWIYHVLREAAVSSSENKFENALEELYDRLFGAIQNNVLSGQELQRFGNIAFNQIVMGEAITNKNEADLIELSIQFAKITASKEEHKDILHSLNRYLSSEPFTGAHVTTGTVFKNSLKDEWWVCVSPHCDMVPRQPNDPLGWNSRLHPIRPMMALLLDNSKFGSLAEAEQARTLFVKFKNKSLCLKAFDELTRQPRPHMFLLCCAGKTTRNEIEGLMTFDAHHILKESIQGDPVLERNSFLAVAQLRPAYANRLLQQTGNHTSRIGVDFVNFGKKDIAPDK